MLLVVGAFIVRERSLASPSDSATAWSGSAISYLDPSSYGSSNVTPRRRQSNIEQGVSVPFVYVPPAAIGTVAETARTSDLAAIVAELLHPSPTPAPNTDTTDTGNINAYDLIPSSLISTSTTRARTATQQALYDYGNEVGSLVQTYENNHSNQVQTLKDQVADRTDPAKNAAVAAVGNDLAALGRSIAGIDSVPPAAQATNSALAKSYEAMGANLARVPLAQTDSGFVAAINAYNASADTFTRHYVALAELFGAYGVTFEQGDPGSAFTFSYVGGF
jgi:hypothetical protein